MRDGLSLPFDHDKNGERALEANNNGVRVLGVGAERLQKRVIGAEREQIEMNAAAKSPSRTGALRRWAPLLAAGAGLAVLCVVAAATGGDRFGARLALSALIGAVAGVALYHASFGFTGAWRRLQRERRGAGVRAQALLIGLAALVAFPLIGEGQTGAWVFPVGLATAVGAAMFGFGMQLGGGCGSGTLFTVGGGSTRMMVTLLAFLGGSVIWSGTADLWRGAPSLGAWSMIRDFGVWPALLVTLSLLSGLVWLSAVIERRAHGALETPRATGSLLTGPWSLLLGAVALAGVVVACFLLLGRPWGITAAYPLWGAKLADAVGLPVREWAYWRGGRLDQSVFGEATSVMNFGIILGALGAAGAAGAYAPTLKLRFLDLWTAILGGLLMGYGARLAFGCNIGGFVGGVVSGSAHGWSWLVFGALGSVVGVWLRGRIGLDPPSPPR